MTSLRQNDDRAWFVVSRWQQYAGETQANLLRVVGLAAFYGVQLYHFLVLEVRSQSAVQFHKEVTLTVAAWALVAVVVMICLRRGVLPASLKYLSTAADIALLTLLAMAGPGANSPLVHVYFVILVISALRVSLGLVWFASIASSFAYMTLVGAADRSWFDQDHATPVVDQLVMLVSLMLAGIVMGQLVRKIRSMAGEYAQREAQQREGL